MLRSMRIDKQEHKSRYSGLHLFNLALDSITLLTIPSFHSVKIFNTIGLYKFVLDLFIILL